MRFFQNHSWKTPFRLNEEAYVYLKMPTNTVALPECATVAACTTNPKAGNWKTACGISITKCGRMIK